MPESTRHGLTPSQTVGPFLSLGLAWHDGHLVVPEGTPGSVVISGVLLDGAGAPVPDGMIETWQADPEGRFAHPDDPRGSRRGGTGFAGFGRSLTDDTGHYRIVTMKPGAIGDGQAPHIDVTVMARGMLDRVTTRLYFPDDAAANAVDPVLAQVPAERRSTLVGVPDGPGVLRFDIRLQGENETVFLAF